MSKCFLANWAYIDLGELPRGAHVLTRPIIKLKEGPQWGGGVLDAGAQKGGAAEYNAQVLMKYKTRSCPICPHEKADKRRRQHQCGDEQDRTCVRAPHEGSERPRNVNAKNLRENLERRPRCGLYGVFLSA